MNSTRHGILDPWYNNAKGSYTRYTKDTTAGRVRPCTSRTAGPVWLTRRDPQVGGGCPAASVRPSLGGALTGKDARGVRLDTDQPEISATGEKVRRACGDSRPPR
ncbi:hypothetical protein GCM10009751_35020 [Myceligenerans crystallogenes]|uniref:Uncharacterized protein n=1 Tax=Myceligenerans crystallogenes TaxID=316335 RepID=A0ABN2NKJ6_9MICO